MENKELIERMKRLDKILLRSFILALIENRKICFEDLCISDNKGWIDFGFKVKVKIRKKEYAKILFNGLNKEEKKKNGNR